MTADVIDLRAHRSASLADQLHSPAKHCAGRGRRMQARSAAPHTKLLRLQADLDALELRGAADRDDLAALSTWAGSIAAQIAERGGRG